MTELISGALEIVKAAGYKVLAPLPELKVGAIFSPNVRNTLNILYMDCETTGLSFFADHVIEIGLVLAKVNADTGQLIEILDFYQGFSEPVGTEISAEAHKIHGLTMDDVRGKYIDLERVNRMIEQCDFGCSHNAGFDRQMMEKTTKDLEHVKFTCSMTEVNWEFQTRKLNYILMELGYHFNAHRALDDAWAGLWALNCVNNEGVTYLKSLIDNLDQEVIDIAALDAPFDAKTFLYDQDYKFFDGGYKNKFWHKVVPEDKLIEECMFLKQVVYAGCNPKTEIRLDRFNRYDRYSRRVTRTNQLKIMM
ncbi:MAG: exonuclease domain-containing protein [Methylophilus sp.]|uniref:exonuclease domain-containing protein n=1 Tax=Methylophilus sp. TaxID=29541 RepID=UPI003FA18C75